MSQLNAKILAAVAKIKRKVASLLVSGAKIQYKTGETYDVTTSKNVSQTASIDVEGFFDKMDYEESKAWAPANQYVKFVMFNNVSRLAAVDDLLIVGSAKWTIKSAEPTYVSGDIVIVTIIARI